MATAVQAPGGSSVLGERPKDGWRCADARKIWGDRKILASLWWRVIRIRVNHSAFQSLPFWLDVSSGFQNESLGHLPN
jgi:hypothetical protein